MKKNSKKKITKQLRRYRYTFVNPVSGLDLSRVIYAESDEAAKEETKRLARCFGKDTKIQKLVKLKQGETT